MDPNEEIKEQDPDSKDEQRGLLIILGSLVVISTIVIVGIFIFFPFNSQMGPAIIVERSASSATSKMNSLEGNEFISQLNQGSTPATTGASEEFFLEITPEREKPAPVTAPITSSAPAPKANLFDSVANAPTPPAPVPAVVTRPETTSSAPEPAAPTKVTAAPTPKAKATPVVPTKPKGPAFWVQIGSYSDEKLANGVVERLKLEGFEAQKVPFNDGSRQFNRVRMGPYANKAEATKFLNWVKDMKDFQESYVLQTNS